MQLLTACVSIPTKAQYQRKHSAICVGVLN